MTSEALIEKMAREMCAQGDSYPWENLDCEDREAYLKQARAALSVVRDHEKQGLVHAQSAGAERSSYLSAVAEMHRLREQIYQEFFSFVDLGAIMHEPTDDRSAPAAHREPDLPSSHA